MVLGAEERPNIVFIFSDDHTAQAISAYGYDLIETPNIDRLAQEGMLFENAFCTNSICAPSRAVVLTGKHSHLNGVLDNGDTFDGSQETFPKRLQRAGYKTAIIGKWHLKSDPTGFDYWRVMPGQGHYYNPDLRTPDGTVRIEGYNTDVVTDLSVEWMKENAKPGQPFLLMCQYKATHRKWLPGPREILMFDDMMFPEPVTLFDEWEDNASPARNQDMTIRDTMPLESDLKIIPPVTRPEVLGRYMRPAHANRFERMSDWHQVLWDQAYIPRNEAFWEAKPKGNELVRWKYQRYIKDYMRCAAGIDRNVGRILEYLDEAGLADNTIVVYSSDQGFYLGENGWFDKRWMYDISMRMPLLVRWPGVIQPGSRDTHLVQNLDFADTLLEAAGAGSMPGSQGRSLMPLLKSENPRDWRKSVYYHYYEHGGHGVARHLGIRTEDKKLIYFYTTDEWEYYDLVNDPLELLNTYPEMKDSRTVKELKRELTSLRELYADDTGKDLRL